MSLDVRKLEDWRFSDVRFSYSQTDTILYALGVGVAAESATDESVLKFCYEKNLLALPTMAVTMGQDPWFLAPEFGLNPAKVLHSEQSLLCFQPLPTAGTLICKTQLDRVVDKGEGKAAIVWTKREIYHEESGDLVAQDGMAVYLIGQGGFGGEPGSQPMLNACFDDREPDRAIDLPTSINQALLYRLLGDRNPLHVDPLVAQKVGFDAPILHGLSTYGVAGVALLQLLCDCDPDRFKAMNSRFSGPIYPGEKIRTQVWIENEYSAHFRCLAIERKALVLDGGYIEWR